MNLGALISPIAGLRGRPATAANIARNALGADCERARRWASARESAWRLLERHVGRDARVAVVGAGNGHDLPLERLAARAARLDLFDLDLGALRRARHGCAPEMRGAIRIHRCDVTEGAADRVAQAVWLRRPPPARKRTTRPFGKGGYDVVIGDLLYSQLLYPALVDAGVSSARTRQAVDDHGQDLTDALVSRMHVSAAKGGRVIHLHDVVGWWDGHGQPASVGEILAQERLEDALRLISACQQPRGADPALSAERLGTREIDTAIWEWPFAPHASYLVRATVTDRGPS
ncbi:MAG: hypothetical protein ACXVSL_05510 [Solirubrobacteraceae bacterium]